MDHVQPLVDAIFDLCTDFGLIARRFAIHAGGVPGMHFPFSCPSQDLDLADFPVGLFARRRVVPQRSPNCPADPIP